MVAFFKCALPTYEVYLWNYNDKVFKQNSNRCGYAHMEKIKCAIKYHNRKKNICYLSYVKTPIVKTKWVDIQRSLHPKSQ